MSKYFCTMPEILTCPNLDRSLLFAGITVISKLGVRQRRVKCFSNARHFSLLQRTCAACCRTEGASHVRGRADKLPFVMAGDTPEDSGARTI